MKKTLLISILALLGLSQAVAQEYEYVPFVREEVKWVYFYKTDEIYSIEGTLPKGKHYLTLEFKGDTLINGTRYVAMHKYSGDGIRTDNDTIPVYVREDNKVVYGIVPHRNYYPDCPIGNHIISDPYSGNEFMIYDFENPIGFISSIFHTSAGDTYQYSFTDTLQMGNNMAKRHVGHYIGGTEVDLIEGIGYDGTINNIYTLWLAVGMPREAYFHLSHVIENGEIIYKGIFFDPNQTDAVDELVADKRSAGDDNYYNLMGQPVGKDVPTAPGIYIHQGKKIIVR